MTHSPGPWEAKGVGACFVCDESGGAVAQVTWRGLKTTAANARLIAAAPNVTEALLGLMQYVGGWDVTAADHPCAIARKAYQQATGKKL